MKLLETMYTKITKVINKVLSRFIIPDKQYQNIKDLNVDEIMELKSKYGIGGVILDIDGTIRENFEDVDYRNIKWIIRLKKEFKVCMVYIFSITISFYFSCKCNVIRINSCRVIYDFFYIIKFLNFFFHSNAPL